jgi:hypothetical protein
VHFPRPTTRYFQETHPPAFKKGTNDFARFYGLLIDGLQMGYVSGFAYRQVVPAPEAEMPERFKRAEQVFTKKLWREQLRDWDENRKPTSIATHRELQAVNADALSDAELVAYLTRCRASCAKFGRIGCSFRATQPPHLRQRSPPFRKKYASVTSKPAFGRATSFGHFPKR